MKYNKLSMLLATLILAGYLLSSCSSPEEAEEDKDVSISVEGSHKDMGQEYIDSFIFLGESTTYHLIDRGVLSDGKSTKQVWGPSNGTLNLDHTIASALVVYPETNEKISIAEAVSRKKPKHIILTFGLNGAVQKVNKGKEYFKDCYKILLDILKTNSPSTKIFIQSAFPVAENMDMSNYSVDVKTLNRYIDTINSWSAELAAEQGAHYLNTAQCLKNKDGFLEYEYQVGDGHHLTADAYKVILEYIRTHGE